MSIYTIIRSIVLVTPLFYRFILLTTFFFFRNLRFWPSFRAIMRYEFYCIKIISRDSEREGNTGGNIVLFAFKIVWYFPVRFLIFAPFLEILLARPPNTSPKYTASACYILHRRAVIVRTGRRWDEIARDPCWCVLVESNSYEQTETITIVYSVYRRNFGPFCPEKIKTKHEKRERAIVGQVSSYPPPPSRSRLTIHQSRMITSLICRRIH